MTTNMSRLVRYGLLAGVVTVTLAACDTQGSGRPAAGAETTEASSSPQTEGTGPERPRPSDDGTSVSFPDLPAGKDSYDSSEVRQCVTVAWLGRMDVPDGVSVQVKSVRITPPGVFDINGSSCHGVQGCAGSFAFTAAGESCSVSITATASNEKGANLWLAGHCVSSDPRQCDELLADGGSSISLRQPSGPPTADGPPTSDGPPSAEQPPPSEQSPPPSTG
ncbi:hypothetical protein [Actinophytocola sp.]|uniref:hypothetical protein n=1 Tax=Actinophytocola sp. TaxID=1872138 RepID=UPI002ED82C46